MSIHALFTVRTGPEPAVFTVLNGIDEILANLFSSSPWVTMLRQDNFSQLLLIPSNHIIFLLLILFSLPRILVQIPLFLFPPNIQIVTELALLPSITIPSLEELAEYRLGVYAERHFLDLDGFEELGCVSLCLFCGGFFAFLLGLFCVFPLLVGGFGGCCCGFELFDVLLGYGAFFLVTVSRYEGGGCKS